MKSILAFLCLFLLTQVSLAEDIKLPTKIDHTGFQGVLADAGKVYISGQPTVDGLKRVKEMGVTTVINFRTPAEVNNRERVPFDEAAAAEALGLTYIHIPLGGDDHPYTPEALEKFAAAMKSLKGKALIHCTVSWRASHMWAAYLAKHEGMDINTAVAHGRAVGLGTQPIESLLGGDIKYSQPTGN